MLFNVLEPKLVDSLLYAMIEFFNHGIQGTATWSQLSLVPPEIYRHNIYELLVLYQYHHTYMYLGFGGTHGKLDILPGIDLVGIQEGVASAQWQCDQIQLPLAHHRPIVGSVSGPPLAN